MSVGVCVSGWRAKRMRDGKGSRSAHISREPFPFGDGLDGIVKALGIGGDNAGESAVVEDETEADPPALGALFRAEMA